MQELQDLNASSTQPWGAPASTINVGGVEEDRLANRHQQSAVLSACVCEREVIPSRIQHGLRRCADHRLGRVGGIRKDGDGCARGGKGGPQWFPPSPLVVTATLSFAAFS